MTAFSVVSLYVVFFDFSICNLMHRDMTQSPVRLHRSIFSDFFWLKLSIYSVTCLLFFYTYAPLPNSAYLAWNILVITLFADLTSFFLFPLRLSSNSYREALVRIASVIAPLCVTFVSFVYTRNLCISLYLWSLSSFLLFLILSRFYPFLPLFPRFHHLQSAFIRLASCIPYALVAFAGSFYTNYDVVFLSRYISPASLGNY